MEPQRQAMTAGRWVAVVASVLAALPFGFGVLSVASSVLSTSPTADPHGYALIFGAMLAILFGAVLFCVLPLTAPAERRRTWSLACLAAFVTMVAVLLVLLSTQ
ncbi:hypothetical protein [Aeromicrobium sp. CTD01-1L150]|uniref:hypothetical protein n=1 Tax=Aeromicrobium sp. CTD01-1L150 TaxID=3341830 RepID=UPI0035C1AC32